jgi:hypothetical protein
MVNSQYISSIFIIRHYVVLFPQFSSVHVYHHPAPSTEEERFMFSDLYSDIKYCLSSLFIFKGGHAQLLFESAIAIPQLEGSTSAVAIPQLLNKCCSTTATPQFRNHNFF